MKVLTISRLHFQLPDSFEVGISDALRLLANYHDRVKGTDKQQIGRDQDKDYGVPNITDDVPWDVALTSVWNVFWTMIKTTDRKVMGLICISELNAGGKEMINLPNHLTK